MKYLVLLIFMIGLISIDGICDEQEEVEQNLIEYHCLLDTESALSQVSKLFETWIVTDVNDVSLEKNLESVLEKQQYYNDKLFEFANKYKQTPSSDEDLIKALKEVDKSHEEIIKLNHSYFEEADLLLQSANILSESFVASKGELGEITNRCPAYIKDYLAPVYEQVDHWITNLDSLRKYISLSFSKRNDLFAFTLSLVRLDLQIRYANAATTTLFELRSRILKTFEVEKFMHKVWAVKRKITIGPNSPGYLMTGVCQYFAALRAIYAGIEETKELYKELDKLKPLPEERYQRLHQLITGHIEDLKRLDKFYQKTGWQIIFEKQQKKAAAAKNHADSQNNQECLAAIDEYKNYIPNVTDEDTFKEAERLYLIVHNTCRISELRL